MGSFGGEFRLLLLGVPVPCPFTGSGVPVVGWELTVWGVGVSGVAASGSSGVAASSSLFLLYFVPISEFNLC